MNDDMKILQAYLDGELDQEQTAAVKERVQRDPQWRRELAALQQLWSVVDEAAAPSVQPNLWSGVSNGLEQRRQRSRPWTFAQRGLAVAATAAGIMLGFGAGSLPQSETAEVAVTVTTDESQSSMPTLDALWLQLGSNDEDSGS